MSGFRVSSSRMAAFSVAQLIPDTIGRSGLPGLWVFGLKYIRGKRVCAVYGLMYLINCCLASEFRELLVMASLMWLKSSMTSLVIRSVVLLTRE